jgi:probable phosphoglycerate mutase
MTERTTSNSAIVVRHGESEWNVLGKWQGRADTRLTPIGRAQARAAAERLLTDGIVINGVASSSLSRARETAEIIAARLSVGEVRVDDRLVETDVGPWQGLREPEIEAGWPDYLRNRRTPPEFEAPEVVFARAEQALRDVLKSSRHITGSSSRVLVVSHSGVIRTVRRMMQVHDRRLHNLEGCHFAVDRDGNLVAGEFIALVAPTHITTNAAV